MTRDEAREFAKVVQAYADGKVVQWREPDVDRPWCDDFEPDFDTNFQWRIKPEPREWWMVMNCDGDAYDVYTEREDAKAVQEIVAENGLQSPYSIIHVREVIE